MEGHRLCYTSAWRWLCFFLLYFFSDFYTTVYVDGILGALFAYALISHFSGDTGTFSFLNTGVSLFVLTLVKDSGAGLAAIALIIIAVDMIFFKRGELKKYLILKNRSGTVRRIFVLICPLLFVLAAKYSWSLYLSATGTPSSGATGITLAGISTLFSGSSPAYRLETVSNFFSALLKTPLSGYLLKLTFAAWFAVLAALGAVLAAFICKKEERRRFTVSAVLVLLGSLVFAAFLLLLYLFGFSEYEAVNLASFERYISTYMLGALAFLSGMIMLKDCYNSKETQGLLGNSYKKTFVSAGLLAVILLLSWNMPLFKRLTIQASESALETQTVRSAYSNEERISNILDPGKDRLYFVSIGDKGYDYWVTRYTLTPLKINDNFTWSLGEPLFRRRYMDSRMYSRRMGRSA